MSISTAEDARKSSPARRGLYKLAFSAAEAGGRECETKGAVVGIRQEGGREVESVIARLVLRHECCRGLEFGFFNELCTAEQLDLECSCLPRLVTDTE